MILQFLLYFLFKALVSIRDFKKTVKHLQIRQLNNSFI